LATVTGEMGRTCWRHSSQRSTSSVTVRGAAAALLAPVELLQDLGLDLPGLVPGRLGLAANLPAEPSLAAGEGNDCGNDMPALSPTRWAASAQPMLWGPTLLGTTEPSANSFTGQQRGIEGC
jgi:hypothetical protein